MLVEREVSFLVTVGDRQLRRGENGGWEERFGESWETIFDDAELEQEFLRIGLAPRHVGIDLASSPDRTSYWIPPD